MKDLSYRILGDNPENLKNHTPQSRKKIQALATAVIIPTVLWFITGFLTATTMLKLSVATGVLIGSVCAFIIFSLDRSIAIINGGIVLIIFRIVIGGAIAFIGSIMIDSAFLSDDIDYYMDQRSAQKVTNAIHAIESKDSLAFNEQNQLIAQRYNDLKAATCNYNAEMDGTGGTKRYGKGEVAIAKNKLMFDANSEYLSQLKKLDQMKVDQADEKKAAHKQVMNNNGKSSIITRINALHEYVFSNHSAKVIYLAFTLVCFLLEMSVVIIKLFVKKSSYELEQQRIEEIRNIKSEQILRNVAERSAIDKRLGHYGRAAMRAVK